MVVALDAERAEILARAPFTYPEIGQTPSPQPGYLNFTCARTLVTRDFEQAAERLMTWQMHERAGLTVRASAPRAHQGVVVEMRLGPGLLGLRIPCRVIYVMDERDEAGFAYGTLPGHPESGEERFLLQRRPDGSVSLSITAFSKPATALVRAAGPVARRIQRLMTRRYLEALDGE